MAALLVVSAGLLWACAWLTAPHAEKKTLELNEEEFRDNIEYVKKGDTMMQEKNIYAHFNDDEFHEGVPKKEQ